MKIYTKTGDQGTTSLAYGGRVSKTHNRVEAYGDVDELISHLGLLRSLCDQDERIAPCSAPLRVIQEDLMLISAHFASEGTSPHIKPFPKERISALEEMIDKMTDEMPPLCSFVLPAGPRAAAECHVARTVCRRCERSALRMEGRNESDETGIRYLNRLSDYLFTLARYLCLKSGGSEDLWIP